MAALVLGLAACGDDDPINKGGSKRTVSTPMVNHVVNTGTGEVTVASTTNTLTIDTAAHTASLELKFAGSNGDQTVSIGDLSATPSRLGFYKLSMNGSNSQASNVSGYVDFNEAAMKYAYTATSGYRVVSTLSEIFYLSTNTSLSYNDTTTSTDTGAYYQFTLYPSTMTAKVQIMALLHTGDGKYFNSITGYNVPVVATATGYTISGNDIATVGIYRGYDEDTGTETKTTDKYPFTTFTANLDLESDTFTASYVLAGKTKATASGQTYNKY